MRKNPCNPCNPCQKKQKKLWNTLITHKKLLWHCGDCCAARAATADCTANAFAFAAYCNYGLVARPPPSLSGKYATFAVRPVGTSSHRLASTRARIANCCEPSWPCAQASATIR